MNILAIETATEACSASLLIGEAIIDRYQHQPQRHAQLLLPMIDELLSEGEITAAQLDGICFGRGPGSFTGLRLAAAVTQGMAMAHSLPVVGVSTLAVLAQAAYGLHQAETVLPMIDARMQEVYWALYRLDAQGVMSLTGMERVSAPLDVSLDVLQKPSQDRCVLVGSGAHVYQSELQNTLQDAVSFQKEPIWPQARDLFPLAQPQFAAGLTLRPEEVEPVYIRDKVAMTLAERR